MGAKSRPKRALTRFRLTTKFAKALAFSTEAHHGQTRKGEAGVPYISHPLSVAALVLEYGGNETQAIAALLHDVIEDCDVSARQLEKEFGRTVARIVRDCTDSTKPRSGERRAPWKERKTAYLAHLLTGASPESLLVSAADKIHNCRSQVHDLKHYGPRVWRRFNSTPEQNLWYYESLERIFRVRLPTARSREGQALQREFSNLVRELSLLTPRAKRRR